MTDIMSVVLPGALKYFDLPELSNGVLKLA
jgi:hypothetical protein